MQTRNHQELWDIPGKFHVSENKTIWQLAVGNRGVDAYSKNTNRVTGETNWAQEKLITTKIIPVT